MFENIAVPSGMRLRLAASQDLGRVKELDDQAFGKQQGISMAELRALLEHGTIILLELETMQLIGESQVLLQSIKGLKYKLQEDEAYYYGTGIHPEQQGHGYGKILAEAQDVCVRAQGKKRATLTVRVENYPSIRMRLECGFLITGYLPDFYGSMESNGARFLMTKNIDDPTIPQFRDITEIPVAFGESVDLSAHAAIAEIINLGYKGYKIDRQAGKIFFGK